MPDDEISALVGQSAISFTGTVEVMGASESPGVPAGERTGVVLVDSVLHSPPAFAHLAGSRVTVRFAEGAEPPAVGERLAIFANGLHYGDTLALAEVGRRPSSDVDDRIAAAAATATAPFADIQARHHDDSFRAHAADADAVVVGRTTALTKVGLPAISEHDPDWWKATIEVHHVEKGDVSAKTLDVVYPNSRDVRWYQAPKPTPSQDGVWVLHTADNSVRELAPYVLLHPEDYRPIQYLDVLRAQD
jgi:hypothetical protein